ncbi:DUF7009 family protein [Mucilaginibacter ximonensis]|uniref:DUF7009 family protein n=1 Tax=Mucilaginibacter ximonensis TaxID=538021 RepID=A0ABW5YCP6_9SPHI
MKIRIKGNAIRYRLTKSDVNLLYKNLDLQDSTSFGNRSLIYQLKAAEQKSLTASFVDDTITVIIPSEKLDELAQTDRVGFDGNDGTLYILVEKDFQCLDDVAEDQSDNYPNPLAAK